jgi:DNA-binding NarL/FixJ family response regulator
MLLKENAITVAIVDDHPIVIEGLQKLLLGDERLAVAGSFTLGGDFLSFLRNGETPVNIVLLDIKLPDISGIQLCREIKLISPATCVLALSNHNERSIIMQMLQNGASGYLLKNASAAELTACINEALSGTITFSAEVKEIIARPSMHELKNIPPLTKREKEILLLIADGKTSADIAAQLFLSPLTVETHRRNLMQKFEVKNVAALIKIAVQQHLV